MDAGGAAVSGDEGWTDPRWAYPEYAAGSVVEIRVHGIGGEPPAQMSRDPHPRLVGGDALAGFWRARNPVVGTVGDGAQHVREVLAWGGQTSGTLRHAFWILLLPFALFNVAGRMHGFAATGRRATAYRATARVLAYTMTLTVMALLCGIAFDLIGAQCAALPGCLDDRGAFFLAPLRFFEGDGAARMAFLALIPTLAVVVLWLAGRYRTQQLEGFDAKQPPGGGEAAYLQDPAFWDNAWPASRLRGAHATGAFAFVAATLCLSVLDVVPGPARTRWLVAAAVATAVVVACGVIVALPRIVLARSSAPDQLMLAALRFLAVTVLTTAAMFAAERKIDDLPGAWAWIAAAGGLALVALWVQRAVRGALRTGVPDVTIAANLRLAAGIAAIVLALPALPALADLAEDATVPGEIDPAAGTTIADDMAALPAAATFASAALPGVYAPAYALLPILVVLQAALLVLLAGLGVDQLREGVRRRDRLPAADPPDVVKPDPLDGMTMPANLGGATVGLFALLLLVAAFASVHTLLLDWLGDRVPACEIRGYAGACGGRGLVAPVWYGAIATGLVVAAPFTAVIVIAARRFRRRPQPTAEDVAADLARGLAEAAPLANDGPRLARIAKGWQLQQLLRFAGTILTLYVGTALLITVVFDLWFSANLQWLSTAALLIVAVQPIAAVLLIRNGLQQETTRREVGRLWDVLTFWPRVSHPFAPPCYGEAIVPLLARRVRDLLGHPNRYRVMLAGHSQGSVVALAAMATLPADIDAARLALVTYGSPIAILYERAFRGLVGTAAGAILDVERKVGSWHHLYAMTEPFALPLWWRAGTTREVWQINCEVPHADTACPVCGWSRAATPPVAAPVGTCDYVVSDPDRWRHPLDALAPKPRGHSSYHDSREVDRHLHHLARGLAL